MQTHRRLTADEEIELIRQYQDGALLRELAVSFSIDRRTVGKIVKAHGVVRNRGLSDAGIAEAVRRYTAGESLAVIGKSLGVDACTVRSRLLERGVRMRDAQGRDRSD